MIGKVKRGNKMKWNGLTKILNVEKMGRGDKKKRRRREAEKGLHIQI